MYRLIRLMIALLIVIPPGFLIVWLGVLEMNMSGHFGYISFIQRFIYRGIFHV